MTLVTDVRSFDTLIQTAIWFVVILGMRHAIFSSMPAEEAMAWLMGRMKPLADRIGILTWEINRGIRFDPRIAKGDKLTAGVLLATDEIAARTAEREQLASASRPYRLAMYLLQCQTCQVFWLTVALSFALTRNAPGAIATGLAYMGVLLLHRGNTTQPHNEQRNTKPCKSCGQ